MTQVTAPGAQQVISRAERLAAGQPDARGSLSELRCGERGRPGVLRVVRFVVAWPLAARLAHEVGDRGRVEALLDLLYGRHHGVVPPLVGAEQRLTLARALDDPADRVSAIEDAVADLRSVGSPYHLAHALLDLAGTQQAAGKDPADVIEEAASIGTTLGAPQVVARAASLMPRPPAGERTSP